MTRGSKTNPRRDTNNHHHHHPPPRTPPLDQVCGSLLVDPGHYDLGLRLKIQGGRFCLLGYCRVALASETAAASAKGAFFLSCSPPPAGVCACCRRR